MLVVTNMSGLDKLLLLVILKAKKPNTTSITQSINEEVIKNLKLHYRKILSTRRLTTDEENSHFQWNISNTFIAIKYARNQVKSRTIANCILSTGFVHLSEFSGNMPIYSDENANRHTRTKRIS